MQTVTKFPGSNIRKIHMTESTGQDVPSKTMFNLLLVNYPRGDPDFFFFFPSYSAISRSYLTLCKTPPSVSTAPLQPSLSQASPDQGDGGLSGFFPWFWNLLQLQREPYTEIKLPLCWSTGGSY